MFEYLKGLFRNDEGNVPVISVFIVFGIALAIMIIVGLVKSFS